jgi:hypothetical protein
MYQSREFSEAVVTPKITSETRHRPHGQSLRSRRTLCAAQDCVLRVAERQALEHQVPCRFDIKKVSLVPISVEYNLAISGPSQHDRLAWRT